MARVTAGIKPFIINGVGVTPSLFFCFTRLKNAGEMTRYASRSRTPIVNECVNGREWGREWGLNGDVYKFKS